MKVSLQQINSSLVSVFKNPNQIVVLDANILITPNRNFSKRELSFDFFKKTWLEPLFREFSNLSIHESVFEELVNPRVVSFVEDKLNMKPPRISILRDSSLTLNEKCLQETIIDKIYCFTKYEPQIDNKDDRGEVRSLSFMAVKGLIYFASNDNNALRLIEKPELRSYSLGSIQPLRVYELIYYFSKRKLSNQKDLKTLYKYLYRLTERERNTTLCGVIS